MEKSTNRLFLSLTQHSSLLHLVNLRKMVLQMGMRCLLRNAQFVRSGSTSFLTPLGISRSPITFLILAVIPFLLLASFSKSERDSQSTCPLEFFSATQQLLDSHKRLTYSKDHSMYPRS